ncbi:hypothetical protein C8R46DRAFT_1188832 [Mycena filopes]|nr:hypothetical protein C8R46DRAFT_1188832 [Mycena filopes]
MEDASRMKRRRTDASDASPLVRSEDYWFDDGNIILQVETTQFRLVKSILSMHSSVFRDMFTMPLPKDEPRTENCPVVVLSGDTVQDWVLFLGVLFPRTYVEEAPTATLLAAILRLSKKYDCEAFRKDCLRRLRTEFPTTLREFDILTAGLKWDLVDYEPFSTYPVLVSLAREVGLYSLLPALYVGLLTSPATFPMTSLLYENAGFSPTDRLACLTGYTNLLHKQSITTFRWLDFNAILRDEAPDLPADDCKQPSRCVAALKEVALDFFFSHRPEVKAVARWDKEWGQHLCSSCRSTAREVFKAGREECWAELPEIFGLPEWETLKALDFE